MDQRDTAPAPMRSAELRTGASDTRLHGGRLAAARAGWVLILCWILIAFGRSLPGQLFIFQHPSSRSAELTPAAVVALHRAGISLATYAWVAVGVGGLIMLAATALALVLFWRRGDDWMVLLASLLFPAYAFASIGPTETFHTALSGSALEVGSAIVLGTVTFGIIYAVLMLFPSGRFVPAWSWILLLLCVLWVGALAALPKLGVLFLGYPLFLGAAIVVQVYRYRRVSTPMQRQQTRWVVAGLIVALLANQAFWGTSTFITPLGQTLYPPIAFLVLYVSVLMIPLTFFIAIQRHRLYEIDTIINRALVYGTLTAILAGVYFGMVLGAQAVTGHFSGQSGQQPIVIVATTLLVAALFAPLRRMIQRLIDRAFYRSRYNAVQTLLAYRARMRMETNLGDVSQHLIEVVEQTMQPTHVSLWLARMTPDKGTAES
jgi:hypothetical protein